MAKQKVTKKASSEFGRVGGAACLEKHGKNYYSELAKKRWAKKRAADKAAKKPKK